MLEKKFQWSKVPLIGGLFWATKLISTGQGESLSDFSSQIFGQQHAVMGDIFTIGWSLILFGLFLFMQLRSEKYRPIFYWLSVALLAVFGTNLADDLANGLGLSHMITAGIFAVGMIISFVSWHHSTGDLSIHHITTLKQEIYYWITVMFSFALGTAVGDWLADTTGGFNPDPFGLGLGLLNTGLILGAIFLALFIYRFVARPKNNTFAEILTFWLAYILTRPVGASFADYFGYDFHAGFLGNKGMSIIWLSLFVILMSATLREYHKKENNHLQVT
ncbi:hypothetical protein ACFO26_02130 [Lactococcus nasutitermitis]|uniref:Membrane-anchored protein n=1 Tax=Lactococcus nasutitermitis TaxID=1652957 RepID=A0ABV9JB86_9LACT|nr:hypothetical protein [Lactococcus nasutitermitis]